MKKFICIVVIFFILISTFSIHLYANDIQSTTEVVTTEDAILFNDNSDLNNSNVYEPTTEHIPVEDIVLSEFEEEMYIKDIQNLSATVFPENASEQIVKYSSSNSSVATINQTGKLVAVGKGTCKICVTCDDFSVYYDLNVKVKTESINVKSKFIVLKSGQKYNLEASVQPSDASQKIVFKSKDSSVAEINSNGIISAKSVGSAAIIISNEDTSILVNVVVSIDENSTNTINNFEQTNYNSNNSYDLLAKQITDSTDDTIIIKNIDTITSDSLKSLYETKKNLLVEQSDYDILIRGQDIFNVNNEINTKIDISHVDNGICIMFNNSNNLPGTIFIKLKNEYSNYKYFYLVDSVTNEYHMLNSLKNNEFKVNSNGIYLLTTKNMNSFKMNFLWILVGAGVILILLVIYIFTKRKYWFW